MKNKTIFVACDTSNLNKIKKIINQTRTNKLKIGSKIWSTILLLKTMGENF